MPKIIKSKGSSNDFAKGLKYFFDYKYIEPSNPEILELIRHLNFMKILKKVLHSNKLS